MRALIAVVLFAGCGATTPRPPVAEPEARPARPPVPLGSIRVPAALSPGGRSAIFIDYHDVIDQPTDEGNFAERNWMF